ncbi:MAG TPA: M20/M25/M40 family metallo-hydrolase [Caulobacteraceae bacterium]
MSSILVRSARLTLLAAVAFAVPALAAPPKKAPPAAAAAALPLEATAAKLRDRAMAGEDISLDFVRELTTRFGPRPAGSPNEQAAAAWAADKLRALGFENVSIQPFPVTGWSRGSDHAELVTAQGIVQPMVAISLGEAPGTGANGVEGEVAVFPDLESLAAVPDGSLAGKIVLVDRKMVRMQDGSGYGPISHIRTAGPLVAAKKGAAAFMLRQAATDNHRLGHAGTTLYGKDGKAPIPAFSLTIPDADQIERLEALGGPVRVRLFSGATYVTNTHSQNIIGEIRGREHPEEVILIGAHMDSWDQGTGATDDGTGDAIIVAAAKLIQELPVRPRRTIRVVFYGSEEVAQPNPPGGAFGGHAYLDAHRNDVAQHIVAGESDFGSDRIYAVNLPKGAQGSPFAEEVRRALDPIGVLITETPAGEGGEDVGPTVEAGAPVFELAQDGTRYFDLHHTPDDTFDKIDPKQLHQNVAAWAALIWLIADSDVDFRKLAAAAPAKQ